MLKALELLGFKSFADKTRFDFAPGITCVVGPNGSGKSNVVDAIKWILGDQSPKSLRGKEMTDVIFNGSANRKPAGMAEAMLTFDNSRRTLSIDADSVVVGRRIYRSGESEYLINRLPARLKDIKDLFLGSGAGTSAYSIIEQGRVDQLLQTTNVNRRVVFEEAAGISRFKARKIDAQRKLERVAQNLLRLSDIVKEVETRLTAARSQASKAARFRELSQQLRELRIGSAADDFRELSARLEALEAQRAALAAHEAAARQHAEECQRLQQTAESRLAECEEALRAAEAIDVENREARAALEATLRHQQTRDQELAHDALRLEEQQRELAARVQTAHAALSTTQSHLDDLQAGFQQCHREMAERQQRLAECEAEVAGRRAALDSARASLVESMKAASALAAQMANLESQQSAAEAAWREAQARLQHLASQRAALEAELSASREPALMAEAALVAARRDRQLLLESRAALLAAERAAQQKLAALRESRAALAARKSLLEELERRQEGLGAGLKQVLSLAAAGARPPWNGVRGSVADLLEVDLENAALVEVALAERAHWVVIEQTENLLAAAMQGALRLSGRVGFLPLPAEMPSPESRPGAARPFRLVSRAEQASADLSGYEGVVCRADRLIRAASGIRGLPEVLLADTWIVTTLEAALSLASRVGSRCRFVTLQGELLENQGTLYLGPQQAQPMPLSRKSELRALRGELARLDQQRAALEHELQEHAAGLARLAAEEAACQARLDDAAAQQARCAEEVARCERALAQACEALGDAAARCDQAVLELDQSIPAVEAARQQAQGQARRQAELEVAISEHESLLARAEASRRAQAADLAQAESALARLREQLEQLQAARNRLDHQQFQEDLQYDEVLSRLQAVALKRQDLAFEIGATRARLEELAQREQGHQPELAQARQALHQARQQRGELAQRELEASQRVRELREQAFQRELAATDLRHQRDAVAARLRDEYQVEVEQAAAQGATARRPAPPGPAESAEVEPLSSAVAGAAAELPQTQRDDRHDVEAQIERLRRKLKQLGQVNTESLRELDELEARFARLSGQLQDLVEARNALEEIIRRINQESRRMFLESFEQIRANFQELFRKLFGGGEGDVRLEDPNDVLECGIEIVARPPGKELRALSLLSGGEKTLTAVALLLAMFKAKPSPYCILDEVDAALDEGNVNRYLGVLQEFQQWTQFIVVTHNKRTMSGAEVLYGVTMEEAGVSKRMSVRFEDIGEDGQFKAPAAVQPQAPAA